MAIPKLDFRDFLLRQRALPSTAQTRIYVFGLPMGHATFASINPVASLRHWCSTGPSVLYRARFLRQRQPAGLLVAKRRGHSAWKHRKTSAALIDANFALPRGLSQAHISGDRRARNFARQANGNGDLHSCHTRKRSTTDSLTATPFAVWMRGATKSCCTSIALF